MKYKRKMEYTQIFKLKDMLDKEGIKYEYKEIKYIAGMSYYIVIRRNNHTLCSAIQGPYSYGSEYDLLEIMGLLTKEEEAIDEVAGGLTAEEVFKRIKAEVKP